MKTIENFIDETFIDNITKTNEANLYENIWKSNQGWQQEIIGASGMVLIRDLSDEEKGTLQKHLYSQGLVDENHQIVEFEAQAYLWHKLSYIPWHNDKEEEDNIRYAATLYINSSWNANWGGLFLYKCDGNIHGIEPKFNRLVFNNNNYEHATTMLSLDSPFRQTVQLFWKVSKK